MAEDYEDLLPGEEPEPREAPDAPHNSASRKSVSKKARALQEERAESWRFWHAVLSDKIGRREVWRLLNDAHTFEEKFGVGPNGFPQPELTWFNAGTQDFGNRFYRKLAAEHRALVLLMHDEFDHRFAESKSFAEQAGDRD